MASFFFATGIRHFDSVPYDTFESSLIIVQSIMIRRLQAPFIPVKAPYTRKLLPVLKKDRMCSVMTASLP
jgi:hypothetical protein